MTEDLYALPLDEFTPARNALEKQLRKEGKRDQAAEVKALRKPTAPAWALNRVARSNPKGMTALTKASEAVRREQERLLAGGEREKLAKAVAKQRELVGQLVGEASAAAKAAGIAATAAFEDKVSNTLRAAAVDEDVAGELAEGRLSREHEAVGMFGFGGEAPAAGADKPAVSEKGKAKAKPRASRKTTAADRRREAERRRLGKELDAAREAMARAGRTLKAAERSRDEERERAQRAAARLKDAEGAANNAAKALRSASAEVKRLDRRLKD